MIDLGELGADRLNGLRLSFLAAWLALGAHEDVDGAAELLQRDLAQAQALQARSKRARSAGPVVATSIWMPPLKSTP